MKPMRKIVLFGAGGHALVVREMIELSKAYSVAGVLLDDDYFGSGRSELADLAQFRMSDARGLAERGILFATVAIGDNRKRVVVAERLRAIGLNVVTVQHPSATVSTSASIGEGSVIMAGVAVSTMARIGRDVIVNTSASVDHDCVIEDGVHLSPGVHLAGSVHVGRLAWIGIGAVVSNNLEIGSGSIVGAGSVVVRNVPSGVVVYGVPARVVRTVSNETCNEP